jgi:hypothetical protein
VKSCWACQADQARIASVVYSQDTSVGGGAGEGILIRLRRLLPARAIYKGLVVICAAAVAEQVVSAEDMRQVAWGVGYALVVHEKCTGIAPGADYVPRIRDGMFRNGISDDDWRGFVQGALEAERRFRQKPPAKECREARAVKAQADKAFL